MPRLARSVLGGPLMLLLVGCASLPPAAPPPSTPLVVAPSAATPVEVSDVPFFPQHRFHCGPAALATLLVWSGVVVTPDQLAPQVYLPERKGALQIELLAAARRYQRIPYVLSPTLAALRQEVAAGHPVLVMQNLGLSWYPRWHYAVVVGIDAERVVLRSGKRKRHVMSLKLFERTWRRAERWAMLALPPQRLPPSAAEASYLQAAAVVEALGDVHTAGAAYAAAVQYWPHSVTARLGLGNTHYARGELMAAVAAYRELLVVQPDYAPALNNLALVLADLGHRDEALDLADRALARGGPHAAAYRDTLRQISARHASP